MIECEDLSTQPNEGGGGGKIVEYLDRHDVQCPENKVHAWKYASDHDLSLTIYKAAYGVPQLECTDSVGHRFCSNLN